MHIHLKERETISLPESTLTPSQATHLASSYAPEITLTAPSILNDNRWQITTKDTIGIIPLNSQTQLHIHPKIPIQNIFTLLATAYDLPLHIFKDDQLVKADTFPFLLEILAIKLAQGILTRAQRGLHRDYITEQNHLPYLRGRLLTKPALKPPTQFHVRYNTLTPDIPHNQLLAQAMTRITESQICTHPLIQKAVHTLRPISHPAFIDFETINYDRLTQDYRPLHALSRFFIESISPANEQGDHLTLPFLIHMPSLFERFIAKTITAHTTLKTHTQYHAHLDQRGRLSYQIDLLLQDSTNMPVCVIDTKYKYDEKPQAKDLYQIVTYATAQACSHALLIYPHPLRDPYQTRIGNININAIAYDCSRPITKALPQFIRTLQATVTP